MEWDEYDHCEECRIYGDDYLTDGYDYYERYCSICPLNPDRKEDDI